MSETMARIIAGSGTLLCFLLIALKVLWLLWNLLRKREVRIPYIREYKKGSFITNYLVMLLIYFVGILYETRDLLRAFPQAVSSAADFLVLRLNTTSISALMNDSTAYNVLVYVGYFLIVAGAVLLTLSVVHQHLWSAFRAFLPKIIKKERLYVLGYCRDNLKLCKSDENERFEFIIGDINDEEGEKLFIENQPYVSKDPEEWLKENLPKLFGKRVDPSIFVINAENDNKNIALCKLFVEYIASSNDKMRDEIFSKTAVYVIGSPSYQAIYENISKHSFGIISYVNKHQKIAMDLIDRYPLSLFMNEEQIDYETSLLKNDVNVNVCLVGFGKTNQQILLSSVAVNQFLEEGDGIPRLKPVKYFIFDKTEAKNNKNMNHEYYRFEEKIKNMDQDDYLPLPPKPADEEYFKTDVNDLNFYKKIKEIVTRNKKDANFIVVSFGDDLENLDMAERLVDKCKEWDLDKVTIFVRAFEWRKEQTTLENQNCYFFGNEAESVFNIDKLRSDKIYKMAKLKNETSCLEKNILGEKTAIRLCDGSKPLSVIAKENWYKEKTKMQRDSRLFSCLALRFKLNLMGLDYCENTSDKVGLSEEEYMAIYASGDYPVLNSDHPKLNGKHIISYPENYKRSRRGNMAIQEHYRWASYMISRGIVPSPRKEIESDLINDGKNYELRRHGNLTSYEGLFELRKIIASRKGKKCDEHTADTVKYRYQVLDDAYWLLTSSGFKIVKKSSCRGKICDFAPKK